MRTQTIKEELWSEKHFWIENWRIHPEWGGWKVRIVLPTYSPPSQKTADSYRPNRQSEEFWKSDSTSNLLPSLSKNSWLYRPNRQLLHQEISWHHAVHAGYISRDCTKKSAEIFYNPWVQKEAKHSKSAKVKKEAKITRLGQIGYRKSQVLPEDKYHPKRHLSTQKPNLSWIRTGVDKKSNEIPVTEVVTNLQKPCDRSCHKSSNICQAKISVGLELGLTKNQPNMLRHVGTRSAAWQKTLLVSVKRKSLDRRSERTRLSSPAQDKTRVGQIQLKRSGQIVRKFLVKPTMAEQFSNEREMTKRCQFDSKKPDVALPKNY